MKIGEVKLVAIRFSEVANLVKVTVLVNRAWQETRSIASSFAGNEDPYPRTIFANPEDPLGTSPYSLLSILWLFNRILRLDSMTSVDERLTPGSVAG